MRLDLDHVGAEVGERLAGVVAHLGGEIEHADVIELWEPCRWLIVTQRRLRMVLRDQRVRLPHPVTPMPEIRRRKGMLFDEFTRKIPIGSGRIGARELRDEQGRIWVPMVDAAHGLRYEFDEPSLTADAEDRLGVV